MYIPMFLPFLSFFIAWFFTLKKNEKLSLTFWIIGLLLTAIQFKIDVTDPLHIGL